MKTIEVALFSGLKIYGKDESSVFSYKVHDNAAVSDVIKLLNIPEEKSLNLFVNGTRVFDDYVLSDGDRLAIFPIVAGG